VTVIRLLIVDDHPVFRDGFAALVAQAMPEVEVLHARDAPEALAAITHGASLDLVVLDLFLPGMTGLAAIGEIGRLRPDLPVMVLTSSEDPEDIRLALDRGASGFVPKSAAPTTLLSAMRLVLAGEIYIPPLVLARQVPAHSGAGQRLTERQTQVLRRLAQGESNKEIARALNLSEKTVKAHLSTIFKALGVANRTHAIAAARLAGIL
jgi:DNA-binding NarL/FixJ family response regulator